MAVGRRTDDRLDEILDAVTAGSRVLVGIAARALDRSEVDITLSQCRTLVTLAQSGHLNLIGLAEALGVSPSTATRMCDRLVAKGLIERERVEGGVSLSPSPAGLKVIDTVTRARRAHLKRIVSKLEEHEQRDLLRCMEAFRQAAGELGEGEWALGWWD